MLCPNITGQLVLRGNDATYFKRTVCSANGAFELTNTASNEKSIARTDGVAIGVDLIKIAANTSNATYSNDKIQPPAAQILIIIKT